MSLSISISLSLYSARLIVFWVADAFEYRCLQARMNAARGDLTEVNAIIQEHNQEALDTYEKELEAYERQETNVKPEKPKLLVPQNLPKVGGKQSVRITSSIQEVVERCNRWVDREHELKTSQAARDSRSGRIDMALEDHYN